jgi:hypothetical protein
MPINANKFICEQCNFKCSKNSNWNTHILTAKHKKIMDGNEKKKNKFVCDCGNEYKYNSGLSRHKKICTFELVEKSIDENIKSKFNKNLMIDIIKELLIEQNKQVQEQKKEQHKEILEQNKQLQEQNKQVLELYEKNNILINKLVEKESTNVVNNIQNNNQFNLNVFLNEKCKDAINMEDFLDSIKLTVMDFEETGKLGFVSGISRIFIENIKKMDVHERPLHCTDLKRETVYIKENNKWEKEDTNKSKLNNVVKRIVKKNICQLPNWQKENPGYLKSNTKANDDYIRISLNSLGSEYDDEQKRMDDKIIRNMLKEVVLDKNKEIL